MFSPTSRDAGAGSTFQWRMFNAAMSGCLRTLRCMLVQ